MPCYNPYFGWKSLRPNENGRHPITFQGRKANLDQPVTVPCGKCIGCHLDRSGEWAIRAYHESTQHEQNAFVTLTFNEQFLPENGSISKGDVQTFIKNMRAAIYPKKISYMACGEYGPSLDRPHYHALIFGHDFTDKEAIGSVKGNTIYTSKELENYWPWGFNTVGEVNLQTAGYVARYTAKKVTGALAAEHYKGKTPEFLLTSRKPALGLNWLKQFHPDLQKGFLTINGKKRGIPKYYMKKYEDIDEYRATLLRSERALHYDHFDPELMPDRLAAREKCKQAQTKTLTRSLDNET